MMSGLVFLFVLSVLVLVHEYGHFLAARCIGVRVQRFSIGFGPVLFSRRFGETEFCVSLLPLGGYVKMAGEDPSDAKGLPWEFQSRLLWEKFFIVFAGPLMNAVLAIVLFTVVFWVGQPALSSRIGKVLDGSPAQVAGLLAGDRVLSIGGRDVSLWEEVLAAVRSGDDPLAFRIDREGRTLEWSVHPQVHPAPGFLGRKSRVSFVGIAPSAETVRIQSGPFEAVGLGVKRFFTLSVMIFASLWGMFTGAVPFKESITGPIGIFFMTQQAAELGAVYLCYFMASLSVSLFVLNLLPVPVLDGGHLLFIVLERVKGSPLKDSTKERMTQVGMVLLLTLMAFVIVQDVQRFSIIDNVFKIFTRAGSLQ